MKNPQNALAWSLAAALTVAAGCAPTERNFGGQGGTGAAGGNGPGGAGGAGGSDMASNGSSQPDGASTGSFGTASNGGGRTCKVNSDCEYGDLCVTASCQSGECSYAPVPFDDDNFCTKDSCIPEIGPVHDVVANCCPHSICSVGAALNSACLFLDQMKDCAKDVCKLLPRCCSSGWDAGCVDTARGICVVGPDKATCACEHSYCETGKPLDPACDPCVHAVCAVTPKCCLASGGWDSNCVTETNQYCNIPFGANCR